MTKRKVLQTTEGRIKATAKQKPKRKAVKRRKKAKVEWSQLFRFSILLILVGVIVFRYYLITEQTFLSFYQSIWNNHKQTISPILVFVGYSLLIFSFGFWVGKRRK